LQNYPFDGVDRPTTEDAEDLEALKKAFPSVSSMIQSKWKAPRPLDDVIAYGLHSVISRTLHEEIFDPFHPCLSPRIGGEGAQRSAFLNGIYQSMRWDDTGIDMSSWRAGTFKALGFRAGSGFQARFIKYLSNSIISEQIYPFLQPIFGNRMDQPPIEVKRITEIVEAAFNWNQSIKCSVPPIDLRTFVVPNDVPFDSETMECYERPLGGTSRTKVIVSAGSCGLKLYECEKNSEGKILVRVRVLKKIKVLVRQNYDYDSLSQGL